MKFELKSTAMKTTLTFILAIGFSASTFCQVKTTTNIIKAKPLSTITKSGTTTTNKHTLPEKKDKTKMECPKEKYYKPNNQVQMVYACPKCSYESKDSGTGKCPKDGYRLKYQQESLF